MQLEQTISLGRTVLGILLTIFIVVSGGRVEEVRLVGGRRWEEGRVEVRMGGEWGTVCDDEWDHQDARVVCRMLRQSGGIAYSKAYFGQGEGRIMLDSVGCTGDEDNLNMCMVGLPDVMSASACTHAEDAGVRCGMVPPTSGASLSVSPLQMSPLSGNCREGSAKSNIRLVGTGRYPTSGLVQVKDPGQGVNEFGYVCDDQWNLLNARVVCKQLCFDPADALPGWRKPRTLQLPPSARIVLDDVQCSGLETSLGDCRHRPWNTHDCSASELAAVTCSTVAASPRVPRAEVQCLEDRMVVTFQRRLNPALQPSSLVAGPDTDTTCSPQLWADSDSIRVSLSYQLCATLMQSEGPKGNLSFQSSILVPLPASPSPGNGMKRVTEYKIKVQCRVAGSYIASRRLPHVGQPVLPASGTTRLQVAMLMYRDDTFTAPVATSDVVLAPGGWINLGLALNTNQRIRLVVTSCYAGPDLSDPRKPKQALLLDKCVQEDTVSTYTLNDTFWGLRFQPFSFKNFSDLTIDCEAYACKTDQASCDRSCNSATNKHKGISKRRRRHVQHHPRDQHAHQVTVPRDHSSQLIALHKTETVKYSQKNNSTLQQRQLAEHRNIKDLWPVEKTFAKVVKRKDLANSQPNRINLQTPKTKNSIFPETQDHKLLKTKNGHKVWETKKGETGSRYSKRKHGNNLKKDSKAPEIEDVTHLKLKPLNSARRTFSNQVLIDILSATPRNSASSAPILQQQPADPQNRARNPSQNMTKQQKHPKLQSERKLKKQPVKKNKINQSKLKTKRRKISKSQSDGEIRKQGERPIPTKHKLTQSGSMTENDQSGGEMGKIGNIKFRTASKLSGSETGSQREVRDQSEGGKSDQGRASPLGYHLFASLTVSLGKSEHR